MIKRPTRNKKRAGAKPPNLTSIMDATFIFIFFLLMTADFVHLHEIQSAVPIISDEEPVNDKNPLTLTIRIQEKSIEVLTGINGNLQKRFERNPEGTTDFSAFHQFMVDLKKQHPKEDVAILEPSIDVEYTELVQIMDSIRTLRKTDESIYSKTKEGRDEKIEHLFRKIFFSNLRS
jgi:biopolymer transport protein ExbD